MIDYFLKTIPPIVKNELVEANNVDRARKIREEKKKWKKPQPPDPFLNHLNVIATTQYFDEFLGTSKTVKSASPKFVDAKLGLVSTPSSNRAFDDNQSTESDSSAILLTNEEEKTAIEFVVCDVLR